jgi:hypothetical protein
VIRNTEIQPSSLRASHILRFKISLAIRTGLEPVISTVTGWRFIQLS